jgi:hypothetical protein
MRARSALYLTIVSLAPENESKSENLTHFLPIFLILLDFTRFPVLSEAIGLALAARRAVFGRVLVGLEHILADFADFRLHVGSGLK